MCFSAGCRAGAGPGPSFYREGRRMGDGQVCRVHAVSHPGWQNSIAMWSHKRRSMTSKNKARLVGWPLASLTLIFGPFLPVIQFEYNRSYDYQVNAIWEVLYGIGYEIGIAIFNELVLSRPVGTIGFLLWPPCVFAAVLYLSKKVLFANITVTLKACLLIAFLSTFAFNVPYKAFKNTRVPSFTRSMFINY
jgi:hypothetical protein